MPLNVEIQTEDRYDKYFIEKILNLKKSSNKNNSLYVLNNQILESMLFGVSSMNLHSSSENKNIEESIDLIVAPYMHDGKKVIVDELGEFNATENGEFVMAIRPMNIKITPHYLPGDKIKVCRSNHDYVIFKFPTGSYGQTADMMINLFYEPICKSKSTEKTNYKPIPAETIKINNQAA